MAAFSSFQQHHPFQLQSSSLLNFLPNYSSSPSSNVHNNNNNNNNMSALLEDDLDHSTKVSFLDCNNDHHHQPLVVSEANKNSMDSYNSSVVSEQVTPKSIPMDKKRKPKHSSTSAHSKDMREVKGKKQKKSMKDCEENKAAEGYIHVRARRGQATDSHSLAERVRREKISERMKLLQALVPGCEMVTGKALMLDEIINYVQSLQNQVEFLSMKLASVNPMLYDFGMDLESLMVRPDQSLISSLPSPLPVGMQECSPTTANTYPVLDNSPNSLLLQQSQIPNALSQGDRQALWEVDDQRQKIINQSGIINSLFSFPLM